jgi:hypothetical protein
MSEATSGNYEHSDFNVRGVGKFVVALVLTIALSALAVAGVMRYWLSVVPAGRTLPFSQVSEHMAAPRLQVSSAADLAAIRRHEDSLLHEYGWIDRKAGVVRIPIERAMNLIVERGLPVRTRPAGQGLQPPAKFSTELPPPVRRLGSIGNP